MTEETQTEASLEQRLERIELGIREEQRNREADAQASLVIGAFALGFLAGVWIAMELR